MVPRDGPLVPRLRAARARVEIVPMRQLRPLRDVGALARWTAGAIPTARRLATLVRRERASLVHTNVLYAPYGALAAALARVPHVWHLREIPAVSKPARRAAAVVVRRLSARAIAMTDAVRLALEGPQESGKVVRIYDGIDLGVFRPDRDGARIRRELAIPAGAPLVGFVARLDPWKGADVFVRAAAEMAAARPDARFIVCGGALARHERHAAEVRSLAKDLGLGERMRFTGWTYTLDDIPEVMAALDLLVHTPVEPEPFGLVLVEAMATGKPVVATRIGGIPEVVDDGRTGTLVPARDHGAVARAALALLADPGRAAAFGAAGRTQAERRFDVRRYADDVEALYDAVVAEASRPV